MTGPTGDLAAVPSPNNHVPNAHDRGPIEIEAKLRVLDEATAEWIASSPDIYGYAASPLRPANVFEDHYLDLPGLPLRKLGWTLRLRRLSRGTLASLKSIKAPVGALHTRDEIEYLASFDPDPSSWPPSPVRFRALKLLNGQVPLEIAAVRQSRRNRDLHAQNGFEAELSLDHVEIMVGGRVVASWVELELELIVGEPAELLELGHKLARRDGLSPEPLSKGERALLLAQGHDVAGIAPAVLSTEWAT